MRILVTGANGYLGFPLTQKFLAEGFDVTGLDANFFATKTLFDGLKSQPNIIQKDIRQVTANDFSGFDAVVHLAELSNDPLGELDEKLTYEINHAGTARLIQAVKAAGVGRFIYFSSCSVYGSSDGVAHESSPVNPLTAYARCKVLNEKLLFSLANNSFSPVILRNATAFGPSPRMRFDLVINNLTARAYLTREVKMDSDGTPWRPFVHVADIAAATVSALRAPKKFIHREIFNVGSPTGNYQIKDIAQIISEELPGCQVSLNPKGADKRNYRVNFDKISHNLPGFVAAYDVAKGVVELLALYKEIQLTDDQLTGKDFIRLSQIKHLLQTEKLDNHLYWQKGSTV